MEIPEIVIRESNLLAAKGLSNRLHLISGVILLNKTLSFIASYFVNFV